MTTDRQQSLAVVSGPALAEYHFGDDHAFGPHRLQAFLDGMQHMHLEQQVAWLEPANCHLQNLLSFHHPDYLEMLRYLSDTGEGYLDYGDTPARKGIFKAASHVVGSVILMIDEIMQGHYRRGFVPIAGLHHAYPDHCSGFCVLNDCAIAIQRLKTKYQLNKILYVDIDAHHGDGVYYSFENDPDLYIVDFHEDGKFLYPGTGDTNETGTGSAQGTKMNIPMPPFANDELFAHMWKGAEAFIRSIEPQFIILQCGADAMEGDPITHLEYSTETYQRVARSLSEVADEFCQGKMIALGGGGYNMNNIATAWPSVIQAMI